jgi:hypothetical protein
MTPLKDYLVYRLNRFLTWEDQDLLAMQQLAPLAKTYLPWSVSAMRPSGLVKVLNDIVVHQRKSIVECGGGLSTYFIAQLLKERGGHLITIEHSAEWCEILRQFLDGQGLADVVQIVHAPLAPTSHAYQGKADWYDQKIVGDAVRGQKIDLLLVDGPPAYDPSIMFARYPAAPFFRPYFAESYTIVLDDANRKGERAIVERWERELGIGMKIHLIDGHVAVGNSKMAWIIS